MENLALYNRLRTVPNEAKKEIKAGRLKGFTDINPMWRLKALTDAFGACGVGWWYEITDKQMHASPGTSEIAVFVDILLFYVDPATGKASHGIPGTGGSSFVAKERNGPYMSDECFKMALTDALSVAAKALGVGADVYFEKDKSKYEPIQGSQAHSEVPYLKCEAEGCGKVLEVYKDAQGKDVSLRKHAAASKAKFGKVLCLGCINKAESNAS